MINYYNSIESEKLISSPQFTTTFNDSYYIDGEVTEEKLNELDIYYMDNAMFKNYTMNVDGQSTVVIWRMSVERVASIEEKYVVRPRGIALDMPIDSFIKDVTTGLGYSTQDAVSEDIKRDMLKSEILELYSDIDAEKGVIKGIIDVYGRSSYDYNIVDVVRNYFEQFPNIDNPYQVILKPIPTGESYITVYDHTNFINNQAGVNNDGYLTATFTPKQLKSRLDYLYENDGDFKSIMSNSQVVRVGYRQIAPSIFRMYVNGYILDNAKIVTTNELDNKQHYGATVTHVKGGMWAVSPSDYGDWNFHKESGIWDRDLRIGTVFYNYPLREFRTQEGLDSGSVNAIWYDSIGNTTVGNSIQAISTNHTAWYTPNPSNPYVPVGSIPNPGTTPTIETQTLIRDGEPPIKPVPPNPIKGVTPPPIIEEEAEETTDDLPSEPFVGGNFFHPLEDEMRAFYGWLWDRDTWTDKKDMNSNPLEAIISLHTLPLPDGGGEGFKWYKAPKREVVLGYLPVEDRKSGKAVKCYTIPSRYKKFSFGFVDIERTYRDFRDFDREIYIFLPYIGFRQIRCDDVTSFKLGFSTRVHLDYNIDIATGDFVAEITIDKNYLADKKLSYTFNGNMATQIPITATDKTRMEQARWQTIGGLGLTTIGLAGGIASAGLGGPVGLTASLFAMGASGVGQMFNSLNTYKNQNVVSVERSSNLAGNMGALTSRTPFIVINSPIAYDTNYAPFSGDVANVTIQLGQLKGWTKCKYVHVDTLNTITDSERREIEAILTSGVIL